MSIKVKGWNYEEFKKEAFGAIAPDIMTKKKQLVDALKAATPIDTGRARAGWALTLDGIENPVEYIDKLNIGTSKQAGPYFIERTLLRHEGVHPSGIIVRRK